MQAASLCWSDEGDAGRQGCCTFVSYALWPVRHVTLLHMNSVVEAALIDVGGSVIAAIVAFVTTWAVTGPSRAGPYGLIVTAKFWTRSWLLTSWH